MILAILYALCFYLLGIYILYRLPFFKDEQVSSSFVIGLYSLKILAFIGFYWVYTYYYPERQNADMYKYFDDANYLFDCLWKDPHAFIQVLSRSDMNPTALYYNTKINHWFMSSDLRYENSHRFIILFNFICRFISFGNIWVHGLIINFLAFTGLWALYKSIATSFTERKRILLLAIFLCPSVLFWGSGLLKEPLILFLVGMAVYQAQQYLQNKKMIYLIMVVLCISLLFLLKIYIAFLLFFVFAIYSFYRLQNYQHLLRNTFIVLIILLIAFTTLSKWGGSFSPLYVMQQKIAAFETLNNAVVSGSNYMITTSQLSLSKLYFDILLKAHIVSFYRPFPWEISNPFMLLACVENYIALLLLIFCIIYLFMYKSSYTLLQQAILISIYIGVQLLYLLAGVVSMNFGALMRYKMPGLLFLAIVLALLFPLSIWRKFEKLLK
ncbi:MAG: hypothetical protein WCP57_00510 [Bacteroidota bacterium]